MYDLVCICVCMYRSMVFVLYGIDFVSIYFIFIFRVLIMCRVCFDEFLIFILTLNVSKCVFVCFLLIDNVFFFVKIVFIDL